MLVLIIGEIGSGKTLIMVIMALSNLNVNILSNFFINHPRYKLLQSDDFLNIKNNTDVFIDEAYTWLENRRSMKSTNIAISEIKEQRRKTNSTWYVSEQHPNMIDKRFEQYPNVVIECKSRYPIGESTQDFMYKITYRDLYQVIYKRLSYESAKKYFSYYDTNEITKLENQDKREFDMIQYNVDKLLKKCLKLVKIIENSENYDINVRLTHSELHLLCMENGILKNYEQFLYPIFQRKYKNHKKNKEN